MRLWSIHPKYLDTQGLVAVWREALLAKKVLQNKTKGYKKHPQLIRFKDTNNPINAINNYLFHIHTESLKRNFKFDTKKIGQRKQIRRIPVSYGQIAFELQHLLEKLIIRDKLKYNILIKSNIVEIHPLFKAVNGDIENWEQSRL